METLRFRQIHLDFHTSRHIPHIGEGFDPEAFAQTLATANVNSVTCFARCHHGLLYFPSQNHPELIHPHLKNHDLLIQQIEACHRKDIKVPVYTTAQWDEYIMKNYPQWLCVDETGQFINSQDVPEPHFYYTICLNSGYRQYFKDHLQDIFISLGKERIDGIFMDILFRVDCKCSICSAKMSALDFDPEIKKDRYNYSQIMLDEFKAEITAFIREHIGNVSIFYNSSHVEPASKHSFEDYTHLEIESLPSGGWGYDHFPTTVRYARNTGKEIIGMTGKFHTYWGDFHSLKNEAALSFECFNMLALNAGCSIGDQLHPNGILSPGAYELIGKVYGSVKQKEPYCLHAKAIPEIGVLTPEEFYAQKDYNPGLPPELIGTVRMLQELAYQFDIIDSEMTFEKYKLLILPDQIDFSKAMDDKLKAYLDNGGKIIASYHSGIDLQDNHPNVFGVSYQGESPYDRDFIFPNDAIGKTLPKEEFVMYLKGSHIQNVQGNILLESRKPYFNREGDYFCSHQHAPSSGEKGSPAAVQTGNAIYFSHPIFSIYRKNSPRWCKMIIQDAITSLLPEKLISHNGPSTLLTTLNRQEEPKRDILHLLHYITEKRSQDIYTIEDVIPLYQVRCKIFIQGKMVKAVRNIQTQEILPHTPSGSYVEFTLDKIQGHEMIAIEY